MRMASRRVITAFELTKVRHTKGRTISDAAYNTEVTAIVMAAFGVLRFFDKSSQCRTAARETYTKAASVSARPAKLPAVLTAAVLKGLLPTIRHGRGKLGFRFPRFIGCFFICPLGHADHTAGSETAEAMITYLLSDESEHADQNANDRREHTGNGNATA